MQRVEEGKDLRKPHNMQNGWVEIMRKRRVGKRKPTNQANTVEVVGLWRGKSIIK